MSARAGRTPPSHRSWTFWWRSFSSRIAEGPAAFERIPSPLAHVAEALWLQTLSEARTRALKEASSAHHQTEREKADLEVRSHVLSLREAELEERLRRREREHAELKAQVRTLSVALRKEHANSASTGSAPCGASGRTRWAQSEIGREVTSRAADASKAKVPHSTR